MQPITETARLAIENIAAGVHVGMMILDYDTLASLADDDVYAIERAARRAGVQTQIDDAGDLRIVDVEPPAEDSVAGDIWAAAQRWKRDAGQWGVTALELEDIAWKYGWHYDLVHDLTRMLVVPVLR